MVEGSPVGPSCPSAWLISPSGRVTAAMQPSGGSNDAASGAARTGTEAGLASPSGGAARKAARAAERERLPPWTEFVGVSYCYINILLYACVTT